MDRSVLLSKVSKLLEGKHPDIFHQVNKIHEDTSIIESVAAKFDPSPNIQANGFRSLVKIINAWFNQLIENKDNDKNWTTLLSMIPALIKQINIMMMMKDKKNHLDRTTLTDEDLKIVKSLLLDFTPQDIKPFVGDLEIFYVDQNRRDSMQRGTSIFKLACLTPKDKMRVFRGEREQVKQEQALQTYFHATLQDFRNDFVLGFGLYDMIAMNEPASNPRIKWEFMDLPLKSDWVITNPGPLFKQKYPVNIVDKRSEDTCHKVNALYISPRDPSGRVDSVDDSLIVHCHAGGFSCISPKVYASFLNQWVEKLGVAVLCPDYRKAPEHKFPAGLNDCLDTILFAMSGRPEVKDLLGFQPKKILLSGDSAGGNLCVSTAFAMNEIRRNNKDANIKMPIAVVSLYPYSDPTFIVTPSSVLSPLSFLLTPKDMLRMITLYAPTGMFLPRDDWITRGEEIETWGRMLAPAFSEPLINNLAYKDRMKELSDVPFFINVAEFDPVLDGSLLMATSWPGAVIDVFPDVHAWLNFATDVTHKNELNTLYARIAQALKITFKE